MAVAANGPAHMNVRAAELVGCAAAAYVASKLFLNAYVSGCFAALLDPVVARAAAGVVNATVSKWPALPKLCAALLGFGIAFATAYVAVCFFFNASVARGFAALLGFRVAAAADVASPVFRNAGVARGFAALLGLVVA